MDIYIYIYTHGKGLRSYLRPKDTMDNFREVPWMHLRQFIFLALCICFDNPDPVPVQGIDKLLHHRADSTEWSRRWFKLCISQKSPGKASERRRKASVHCYSLFGCYQ